MSTPAFLIYIGVMAGVTYLVRALPMVLFKGRVTNTFILSFLHYVPYAVLGAMTFPAIIFSTSGIWSALAGLAVAVILSLCKRNLTVVALFACCTVFAVEWLQGFLF